MVGRDINVMIHVLSPLVKRKGKGENFQFITNVIYFNGGNLDTNCFKRNSHSTKIWLTGNLDIHDI